MDMIRDLTQEELCRLLTQEEVDGLPSGTKVMIKWSGGNGPHEYKIINKHGKAQADNIYEDYITFVGKERYHTRVFLVKE